MSFTTTNGIDFVGIGKPQDVDSFQKLIQERHWKHLIEEETSHKSSALTTK